MKAFRLSVIFLLFLVTVAGAFAFVDNPGISLSNAGTTSGGCFGFSFTVTNTTNLTEVYKASGDTAGVAKLYSGVVAGNDPCPSGFIQSASFSGNLSNFTGLANTTLMPNTNYTLLFTYSGGNTFTGLWSPPVTGTSGVVSYWRSDWSSGTRFGPVIQLRGTVIPGGLTILVNDSRGGLITSFNYLVTDGVSSWSGTCGASNCTNAALSFSNANFTAYGVNGGRYFDAPMVTGVNYTVGSGLSTIVTTSTYNDTFLVTGISDAVNGSSLSHCTQISNQSAFWNACAAAGSSLYFYNVTGNVQFNITNISGGNYFSITGPTLSNLNQSMFAYTNTSYQALLNVSVTQLFTNNPFSNFVSKNGLVQNTTTGLSSQVLPAVRGNNSVLITPQDGNFSLNITCPVVNLLTVTSCGPASVFDSYVTVGAKTNGAGLNTFTAYLSNQTLGGLLEYNSTTNGSVVLPAVRGYAFLVNVSVPSYAQNTTNVTVSGSAHTVNVSVASIGVTLNFLDEITRQPLNTTNVTFSMIDANGVQTPFSTSNGSITINYTFNPGTYTIRYGASNYSTRDYYLTVGYAAYNVTLYLINQNAYTVGTVEVRNFDDSLVPGAVVSLQRYYNDPSLPNIVQMETANTNGQAAMTLQTVTASYLWTVTYNGVTYYQSTVPEQLTIGQDGQWHRTFIFDRNGASLYNQNTGFSVVWTPVGGVLNTSTSYLFGFSVGSSVWSMTSCSLSLYDESSNSLLSYVAGACSNLTGAGNVSYTTSSSSQNIRAVLAVNTQYFTNQYQTGWSVQSASGQVNGTTVSTVLTDIGNFNGAGFNNWSRMFLSFVLIIVIVAASTKGEMVFMNTSEEMITFIFLLVLFFSYLGWMMVPLPLGASALALAVQQYMLCFLVGSIAFYMVLRRYGVLQ